jgi:hypothetical protein
MMYSSPRFNDVRRDDAALFPIFFQIMYSVYVLHYYTGFKHNDLHENNVLVRTLPRPVEFVFHLASPKDKNTPEKRRADLAEHQTTKSKKPFMPTVPVRFRTRYFAKIIDYGQCTHDETPTAEFKKTPACHAKLDMGFYPVFIADPAAKKKDVAVVSDYLNNLISNKGSNWSFQEIVDFLARQFQSMEFPETPLLGTLTVDAFNGKAMVFR